ncbi:MAG: histidinol-phosphate transaminase [Halobacteriales archaeon]|nr:histidinol-phosphate transaminase [Halobacteriales archaeon]
MKRSPMPRKSVDSLTPYTEEPHAPLNLADNTNLFEPNPCFAEALAQVQPDMARSYPSLQSERFCEAAARAHGVKPGQVATGNGSNELIDLAIRVFAEPGERVAWHPPSFSMIEVFARAAGAQVHAVPLRQPGFTLDADGLLAARAKVTFVCRPNNPTGNSFPRAEVERVVRGLDGLVVVDEAYGDFVGDSFLPLVKDLPNLLVLRTMSKAQGLAALRIGYGIAQEPVIQNLLKVRGPFRLNALSELIGTRAFERPDHVERVVRETSQERDRLTLELRTRGMAVNPSDANFILFRPPTDAARLHAALERRGVAVRKFGDPGLRAWLRATVGPRWVTQRFLAELDDALREVGPSR